ncbi:MAG TPA: hypothetical protein VGQ11_12665 [Candidatus Acidoferrales bacterium]|nr:hypothetical protein [Candidatus Acidoferrales bacterium]
MNVKFLAIGTLVGGIVLFLWGGLTHGLVHVQVREFRDAQAVVRVLHENAPENAVYFAPQGAFVSVAFLPDMSDKTKDLTPMLIRQLLTDMLAAALLCLVLPGIVAATVLRRALWLGLFGLAFVALKILPYSTWYGFSAPFIGMEVFDVVGKLFLAGLVLGALMKKLAPAA